MPLDRRPKLLADALSAIDAIQAFCAGRDLGTYLADLLLRSAVERQFEVPGEACTRLAREDATLLTRAPKARLAIGMRNRIIHGYDAVDDETVWDTVVNDLAPLRVGLQSWLDEITA